MPQTKSAKKSLRQTERRTVRNNQIRKNLDYLWRQFKKALNNNDKAKIDELTKKLIKALDKAAQKNVIHKNKVARNKSRMIKKVNNLK